MSSCRVQKIKVLQRSEATRGLLISEVRVWRSGLRESMEGKNVPAPLNNHSPDVGLTGRVARWATSGEKQGVAGRSEILTSN